MSLKGKITSLTDTHAVLVFEDGQTLNVPVSALEGQAKIGQDVAIVLAALGGEGAGRTKLAQDLLNELLKT